jgi:hypothetical protein
MTSKQINKENTNGKTNTQIKTHTHTHTHMQRERECERKRERLSSYYVREGIHQLKISDIFSL